MKNLFGYCIIIVLCKLGNWFHDAICSTNKGGGTFMRYQSSSAISYFFRNFWKYIYIVLPVAVFMAIFANFSNETVFLQDWIRGNLTEETYLAEMMNGMSLIRQADAWWYGLISLVLLSITFSWLVVKVSRHMRVGGFVVFPLKSAMKVMPSMLIFCACFAVALQLLQFVTFGILWVLGKFLPMNAVIVIGLVLLCMDIGVTVYVWMLMLLCFPLSYSESYPFNVALSYSIREMSKHTKLCVGHAIAYTLIQALVVALDYVVPVISNVVHGLFFAFVIYYVPCMAFTIHHKTLGSERKDISRVLIG